MVKNILKTFVTHLMTISAAIITAVSLVLPIGLLISYYNSNIGVWLATLYVVVWIAFVMAVFDNLPTESRWPK